MMPNPLFNKRLNTSKEPQDRPQPTPPELEHYAGDNNPYRGTEDHGVPATNHPNMPPENFLATQVGETYLPPEKEESPVPVIIVNEYGREFRRHRIHKMTVNNERGLQFIGRNYARSSVMIQNRDAANSIYLYHAPLDPASGPIVGFEIAAKESVTLDSQAAIYLVGSNATYSTVQAVEYYGVQE